MYTDLRATAGLPFGAIPLDLDGADIYGVIWPNAGIAGAGQNGYFRLKSGCLSHSKGPY